MTWTRLLRLTRKAAEGSGRGRSAGLGPEAFLVNTVSTQTDAPRDRYPGASGDRSCSDLADLGPRREGEAREASSHVADVTTRLGARQPCHPRRFSVPCPAGPGGCRSRPALGADRRRRALPARPHPKAAKVAGLSALPIASRWSNYAVAREGGDKWIFGIEIVEETRRERWG
jgi:hypothetical protein